MYGSLWKAVFRDEVLPREEVNREIKKLQEQGYLPSEIRIQMQRTVPLAVGHLERVYLRLSSPGKALELPVSIETFILYGGKPPVKGDVVEVKRMNPFSRNLLYHYHDFVDNVRR